MRRNRDDDDDDDRPRRKKRRADDRPVRRKRRASSKSTGSPLPLILGLGGGAAFLALVGVVVGVIWGLAETRPTANRPVAAGPPPTVRPPGDLPNTSPLTAWAAFRQPDGLYEVRLPTTPHYTPPSFTELKPFGGDQLSQLLAGSTEIHCVIRVRVLAADNLAAERNNLAEAARTKPTKAWLGRTAVEEADPADRGGRVRRVFLDGNKLYEFELAGHSRRPTAEELAVFFDHVVLNPR